MFSRKEKYSRSDVWQFFHPNKGKKPQGIIWNSGYIREGDIVIALFNITTSIEYNFDNAYDEDTQTVTWFGKPKTHSGQPLMQGILNGSLKVYLFARWDNTDIDFTFLGVGKVKSFEDGVKIRDGRTALKIVFSIHQ